MHEPDDDHLTAKICDFGTAKLRATTVTETTGAGGTAMYFPPELAGMVRNSKKGDVYSLAATLIELFTNLWFWHILPDRQPLETH